MRSIKPATFTNYYLCPCGHEWNDQWDCACDDKCPVCNKEIEPFLSDDGSLSPQELEAALTAKANEVGCDR